MEIEAKFVLSSQEDLDRILEILKGMGSLPKGEKVLSFWDIYLRTEDRSEAVRYRIYGEKLVRTYKRDISKFEGVVKRVEEEREVSLEEFEVEKKKRGTILETRTNRKEYDYGDFKVCFDSVLFHGSIKMLFLEVEGKEEKVKEISKILSDMGFKVESRSKLEIGLSLSPYL
jgi:CYTH domain.